MRKAAFIIPFFGKFNNFFQLFLNSCGKNKDYDWIIFTDDKTKYQYPSNLIVNYTTFEKIKSLFQTKFKSKISLDRPYKLCDFRPMYGYLFQEYLKDYKFWGHCDTDMLFGDINSFYSKDSWDKYEKIFFLGHLTLYKNTAENNQRFMLPYKEDELYQKVLTNKKNCSFDEEFNASINNIYIEHKTPILLKDYSANIYMKSSNFRITRYNLESHKYFVEPNLKAIYIWENGKLFRNYLKNGKFYSEEFLYIHFQSRKMQSSEDLWNSKVIKIIPNRFEHLPEKITPSNIKKIRWKYCNLHYFRLRGKNLITKIRRIFA